MAAEGVRPPRSAGSREPDQSSTPGNRRQGERRATDRRRPRQRRRDDAAHSAPGQESGQSTTGRGDSFFDAGWLSAGDGGSAWSRGSAAGPASRSLAGAPDSALARVFRTYAAARAAIGVGLVLLQGGVSLIGGYSTEWLALVSLAYAVQAITLWLLPRFSPLAQPQTRPAKRRRQWLVTIGVDLLAFVCLHLLQGGSIFNYGALLVLPVLMAGVFSSRLVALGTASGVALVLLAVSWRNASATELSTLMLQTGMAGLGLFIISLLAGELAARLAREELAARGSLELARQQAQLNRLVIEEMVDGVLVVDQQLRVRAANPAARALLVSEGLCPPAPFMLHERAGWLGLQQAVQEAMSSGQWPEAGRDLSLSLGPDDVRTLRMRVRFMRRRSLRPSEPFQGQGAVLRPAAQSGVIEETETLAVLLLEDLRTLQARIRQEKLAAMGRVSAGIAHEIRNPLAAIAQANALLLEDGLASGQQRLAQIVADNVERLKRLVEDVMEVAPGMSTHATVIELRSAVTEDAADWARTTGLVNEQAGRLLVDLAGKPVGVLFDPEHLRRVLVNLLDNAARHASAAPQSVVLRVSELGERRVALSVFSDGAAITAEHERFLFEPFFSTRSRGTGLGLYICRELCERHGASIDYRRHASAERLCNEFVVSLRRVSLDGSSEATTPGLAAPAPQPMVPKPL